MDLGKSPPIPFYTFQRHGDIVLVAADKSLNLNLLLQSLLRGHQARFSHVLLCVMPGLYVHSTTDRGVHLVAAEDEEANFPAKYGDAWKVLRHQRLANDLNLAARLQWRVIFYLGQDYNWSFQATHWRGTQYNLAHSFCSELVARVFQDIGVSAFGEPKAPPDTLPTDFDHVAIGQDWIDVTADYRRPFEAETRTFENEVFDQDIERLIGRQVAINDPRLLFIETLVAVFKSVQIHKKLIRETEELHRASASLDKAFRAMSKDEQLDRLKGLGIDPHSIKDIYRSCIDLVFVANKSLATASEQKYVPLNFSVPRLPEFDCTTMLDKAEQFFQLSARECSQVADLMINCAEGIIASVSVLRLTKDPKRQQFITSVHNRFFRV